MSLPAGVCPLCQHDGWTYLFVSHGVPVCRCGRCGLTRLFPQPTEAQIRAFYTATAEAAPDAETYPGAESATEREAAQGYLGRLDVLGAGAKTLLVVAQPKHPFRALAEEHGHRVTALTARSLADAPLEPGRFDAVVVIEELEKASDPVAVLQQLHEALQPDGMLLLVTPSMDSWAARFLASRWTAWRPENLYYFDERTVQSVLLRSSFAQVEVARDWRRFSVEHMHRRARAYPRTVLTRAVRLLYRLLPAALRGVRVRLASSAVVVTARRVEPRPRPLLSIVMPVYNERRTFAETMEAVLAKEIPGVDKEVIVVESNSTDGTRELVLSYQGRPGVKVELEDRARGKGHAVRRGFDLASGDAILIQDADLEYDVNDYDSLLEPLLTWERAFVLGSRHTGSWKIRKFTDRLGTAAAMNVGHLLFATALNVLYIQRLRDPFTMFKVFRRDCLHGLEFECNRFDFDYELVIKLLRKGYRPLELPVNYTSRSFEEGKKVSMLRDPLTWIWALLKFRFVPLYPHRRRGR
jgi:hypothetical protein